MEVDWIFRGIGFHKDVVSFVKIFNCFWDLAFIKLKGTEGFIAESCVGMFMPDDFGKNVQGIVVADEWVLIIAD